MRFNLIPDRDGYKVSMSTASTIENELKGGTSAKRLDVIGSTYKVQTQFTLTPEKYNYFRDFVEAYYLAPEWFDILLFIEPYITKYPLLNYKAQIEPESVKLISATGLKFVVQMQLEAYPSDLIGTGFFNEATPLGSLTPSGATGAISVQYDNTPVLDPLGELLVPGVFWENENRIWQPNGDLLLTNGDASSCIFTTPADPRIIAGGTYILRLKYDAHFDELGHARLDVNFVEISSSFIQYKIVDINENNYKDKSGYFRISEDWGESDILQISFYNPEAEFYDITLMSIRRVIIDPENLLRLDTFYTTNTAYFDYTTLILDTNEDDEIPNLVFSENEEDEEPLFTNGTAYEWQGTADFGDDEISIISINVGYYDTFGTFVTSSEPSTVAIDKTMESGWSGIITVPSSWNVLTDELIAVFTTTSAFRQISITSIKLAV